MIISVDLSAIMKNAEQWHKCFAKRFLIIFLVLSKQPYLDFAFKGLKSCIRFCAIKKRDLSSTVNMFEWEISIILFVICEGLSVRLS